MVMAMYVSELKLHVSYYYSQLTRNQLQGIVSLAQGH